MHPSEEVLERYSLGQLTETECAPFEDHLLICAECQHRLNQVDAEIADIKRVCRELQASPAARPSKLGFLARFSMASPVWAAAAAAIVIGLGLPVYRHVTAPRGASDVVLQTSRGAAQISEARVGDNLNLKIDLMEVSAPGPYRIDIVDGDGNRVWSRGAIASSGEITVAGPNNLRAGNYWVRIYAGGGALLREYGLLMR